MSGAFLITGAAKRIGRQLALDLADAGFDIAVHYSASRDAAEDVARQVQAKGRRAVLVGGDLADAAAPAHIMAQATRDLGVISGLINNASLFEEDDIGTLTLESWSQHIDINLRAPVLLAQAFAKALPGDREGNIINMLDQRVLRLNPQFFSYNISKTALWTATRTLAQALAPRIRVNGIGPGPALPSARMDEADFAKQKSLTLLERGTSPEEISAAVKFILSQPSLTGQMIALDGGQHLLWQTRDVTGVKE